MAQENTKDQPRRMLTLMLLLLAGGIWGYVGYRVFAATGTEFAEPVPLVPVVTEETTTHETARVGAQEEVLLRSPFLPPEVLFEPQEEVETEEIKAPEPVPPPIKLIGLVDDTALIQDQSGHVYFLSPGEEHQGARLEKMEHDRIWVRFEEALFELLITG